MKESLFFTGLIVAFSLVMQNCGTKNYGTRIDLTCPENAYNPYRNDTTEIVYESLLRIIAEQHISDFSLIPDKKNLFVVDTYFIRCAEQDTSNYYRLKSLSAVPYRIGNTRFCLKSKEDLTGIANRSSKTIWALQIGYITINGDTAITGMQTIPFKPGSDKRALMAGGGTHYKFVRVNGRWLYFGTLCGEWTS